MDLSRISVVARLRSPWEALDLGFVIARAWWWPMFWSWCIPALCVFVFVSVVFPAPEWVAYTVVWWLKPLFDRGPLFIASRRLFGEPASTRDFLRSIVSVYKSDVFLWLTIRRFSGSRSFDMPLTVLENIQGDARSSRRLMLHRRHSNAALWLTIVGFHIEAFVLLALLSFFVIMVPAEVDVDFFGLLGNEESILSWVKRCLTVASMAVIAPFYAASGFALYISRRIDLEAWDIEIRFRHLAEKFAKKSMSAGASLVIACFLSVLIGVQSAPVSADDLTDIAAPQAIDHQVTGDLSGSASAIVKDDIFVILEGNEFHRTSEKSGWRLKDFSDPDPDTIPDWLISLIEFIAENSGGFVAVLKFLGAMLAHIEFLIWAVVIVLLLLMLYHYRQHLRNFMRASSGVTPEKDVPEVMFGLDVTRESLPEDVPSSVRQLWQRAEHRAAVSLLYRALLANLIYRHDFIFADSDTEGECVAQVKARGEPVLSRYTASLTECWQLLAYGHRVPSEGAVEKLCSDWPEVFPSE